MFKFFYLSLTLLFVESTFCFYVDNVNLQKDIVAKSDYLISGQIRSFKIESNCNYLKRCISPRFQVIFKSGDRSLRSDFSILDDLKDNSRTFDIFFKNSGEKSVDITVSVVGNDALLQQPIECGRTSKITVSRYSKNLDFVLIGNCVEVKLTAQFVEISKEEKVQHDEPRISILGYNLSSNYLNLLVLVALMLIIVLIIALLSMVYKTMKKQNVKSIPDKRQISYSPNFAASMSKRCPEDVNRIDKRIMANFFDFSLSVDDAFYT